MCYKPVDGDTVSFEGWDGRKGEEEYLRLRRWVGEVSRGVLDELTELNWGRFKELGNPIIYVLPTSNEDRHTLRKSLYSFARTYYDSLTSVLVNRDFFASFPALAAELRFEGDKIPRGVVHQLSKDRVYYFPDDKPVTPGAVQQWGLDVFQGRVKPVRKRGTGGDETERDEKDGLKVYRSVGLRKIPGVTIMVGHDEL
ncbi:hypothetical protein QBC47DRAFT_391475 [Echria macrotheca]|uniref:Uncharacterized protein n=1 Tax=Echria macrotheca TaxID=438768 RepID=A0AAJ0F379_9PEZI|nr:hypothetical protein QBC47DRAFT_391475 [Echria macrotheca]